MVSRFLGRCIGLAHCQRAGHLRGRGWQSGSLSPSLFLRRQHARFAAIKELFFLQKDKEKETRTHRGEMERGRGAAKEGKRLLPLSRRAFQGTRGVHTTSLFHVCGPRAIENLRLATVSSRKFSSPPIKVYLTMVLNLRGRERRRRTSITGVSTSLIESRAPPPFSLNPEPRYFCFNEHWG